MRKRTHLSLSVWSTQRNVVPPTKSINQAVSLAINVYLAINGDITDAHNSIADGGVFKIKLVDLCQRNATTLHTVKRGRGHSDPVPTTLPCNSADSSAVGGGLCPAVVVSLGLPQQHLEVGQLLWWWFECECE